MASTTNIHTSALCWIPPVESQEPIQRLRAAHDRQIDRWPPHVNVLYPFVPEVDFPSAAAALAAAFAARPAFPVELGRLRRFKHGRRSLTAWLDPEETGRAGGAWQELQALARRTFPRCNDQTRRGAFVPHLSVGQVSDDAGLAAIDRKVRRWGSPVSCEVGELCLISRSGRPGDPFLVRWRVRLGDAAGGARRCDPPEPAAWRPPGEGDEGAGGRASAASAERSGKVRVTLASNSDRSSRTAVIVSSRANLSELCATSKNKLRVNARRSRDHPRGLFFRETGEVLEEGEEVSQGALLLASGGEAFVGKVGSESIDRPLAPVVAAAAAGYARAWVGADVDGGGAACKEDTKDATTGRERVRLLTWNILSSGSVQGTREGEGKGAASASTEAETAPAGEPNGVRYRSGTPSRQKCYTFLCPHDLLAWNYRAPLVAREILAVSPTVLCLQEVESEQLRWLKAFLAPRGYAGVSSTELGATGGGQGVALFWDTSRVAAVGSAAVEGISRKGRPAVLLQRLELRPPGGGKDEDGTAPSEDEENGRNGSKDGSRRIGRASARPTFVLATTHLKAGVSHRLEEVRENEAAALLAALDRFADKDEPTVLAGDMNAHPTVLDDNDGRPLKPRALPVLAEAGGFRCGYAEATGGPLPYTHWAGFRDREVRACFDHVLLRGEGLDAVRALTVPEGEDVMASACRLPNANYPSDHVALVVDLSFRL